MADDNGNDVAVAAPDTDTSSGSNLAQALTADGPGLEALASSLGPTQPQAPSNSPASTPPAPLQGLGGRLRGVLYGLATEGVKGAIEGAVAPNVERTHFQQNEDVRAAKTSQAQSQAQFESIQSADMAARASREAQTIDTMNEERRANIRQMNDAHADYLLNNFGIAPDITLEGNGQEVHDQGIAALYTLAGENGGKIPPAATLTQPHTPDQPKFKISVYAPSQQDLDRNRDGFRKLVDTANAVQGLPPIDDLTWNSGGGKGYQGQRAMAAQAMQFLSPIQPFTETDVNWKLAQRKQLLAAYEQHTDRNGVPDADPGTVAALSKSVDFLQKGQDDVVTSKSAAVNKQTQLEARAAAAAAGQKAFASAKGSAQGGIAGQMAASGGSTTTGTVDPDTGADEGYLSTLPPQQANTIRAIGEGRLELNSRVMASKDGKVLMSQLTTAYPNFDQSKAQSYFKTRQDFTSGKTSAAINAYNTSIAHLGTMYDHVSGTNSLQLNNPASTVHRQLDLDKQLVSTELTKAVANGQMTEGEKTDILGSISGYTVGSYQDRIKEAVGLLNGKLEAYQQQWNNGAPPGAVSKVQILSPQSQQTIIRIKGNGAAAAPQGRAVRDPKGNILGYTTDGKTMTPVGAQ